MPTPARSTRLHVRLAALSLLFIPVLAVCSPSARIARADSSSFVNIGVSVTNGVAVYSLCLSASVASPAGGQVGGVAIIGPDGAHQAQLFYGNQVCSDGSYLLTATFSGLPAGKYTFAAAVMQGVDGNPIGWTPRWVIGPAGATVHSQCTVDFSIGPDNPTILQGCAGRPGFGAGGGTPTGAATGTATASPTSAMSPTSTATSTSAATPSATATPAGPRLRALPALVTPHQRVLVEGSGFGPGEPVVFYWDRLMSTPIGAGMADGSGALVSAATIPNTPAGAHLLLGIGLHSHRIGWSAMIVHPGIVVHPNTGVAGSTAVVTGGSFPAGQTLVAYWEPGNLAVSTPLSTTSSGTLSHPITFTVPAAAPGRYTVLVAVPGKMAVASASFVVTAAQNAPSVMSTRRMGVHLWMSGCVQTPRPRCSATAVSGRLLGDPTTGIAFTASGETFILPPLQGEINYVIPGALSIALEDVRGTNAGFVVLLSANPGMASGLNVTVPPSDFTVTQSIATNGYCDGAGCESLSSQVPSGDLSTPQVVGVACAQPGATGTGLYTLDAALHLSIPITQQPLNQIFGTDPLSWNFSINVSVLTGAAANAYASCVS